MAQAFNWDEHPIAKAEPTKSKEFNWDEHPIESKQEPSTFSITPRGLLKGALSALPTAGGAAGGFVGSAAGPIGTLGGAGLGYSAGTALKNIGEKYLLDEDKTREQVYMDPIKAFPEGVSQEMGGQITGAIGGKIASKVGELAKVAADKPNADAIRLASKELGFEPTPGMTSSSPYIKNIESSLEQSPSVFGSLVRNKTDKVRKGLSEAGENAFKEIAYRPSSEAGAAVKKGITETLQAKLEPIQQMFEDVAGSTKNMSIADKPKNLVARNIRNINQYESSPAKSILNSVANDLEKAKTVDDIKSLKTMLGSRLRSKNLDPTEVSAIGDALEKMTNLEYNSIQREAIKLATQGASKNEFAQLAAGDEGRDIAKGLVKDLKSARKDFRGLIGDVSDIGKGSGLSKNIKNIPDFLGKLDSIPDEQIVDKLWKTDNRAYLKKLESFDQDAFDNIRKAKLLNLQNASEVKGKVDPVKFLKNVKSIEPETRKLLFGADHENKIKAMQDVVNSLPDKVGPSGTPAGFEWSQYMSPSFWIGEIPRAAQYGIYKNADSISRIADAVPNINKSALEQGTKGLIGMKRESNK